MVSVVGSSLHIDAAYFTDAVYATPMTVLSLDFVPGAEKEEDVKLARQFQVLRNAVNRLAQFYGKNHIGPYVEKKEIRIGAPDFLLPAPCVVPETGDTWTPLHQFQDFSLKFTDACFTTHGRAVFKGRITRPSSIVATPMSPLTPLPLSNPLSQEPSLPLLLPSPPSDTTIVYIKFVRDYGEVVHTTLFNEQLAPTLHWIGRVYGGPIMVIMEAMSGRTVQDYIDSKDEVPQEALASFNEALRILKDKKLVHGDLRPPNVLVRPAKDGKKSAILLDFDWAGRAGEARYPDDLNPDVLWRKDPKKLAYKLIKWKDDKYMQEHLLEQPSTEMLMKKKQKKAVVAAVSSPDEEDWDYSSARDSSVPSEPYVPSTLKAKAKSTVIPTITPTPMVTRKRRLERDDSHPPPPDSRLLTSKRSRMTAESSSDDTTSSIEIGAESKASSDSEMSS